MDNIEMQKELKKLKDNPMYYIEKYTNLELFWYQKLILKLILSNPWNKWSLKYRNWR